MNFKSKSPKIVSLGHLINHESITNLKFWPSLWSWKFLNPLTRRPILGQRLRIRGGFYHPSPSLHIFQQRLLERVIRDGKRVGLHLEKEKQDRIKEINSKMSSLGRRFLYNFLSYWQVLLTILILYFRQVFDRHCDLQLPWLRTNILQGLNFKTIWTKTKQLYISQLNN